MPTLYRYYDEYGQLLYVGVTRTGIARGFAHAASSIWWSAVAYVEFDTLMRADDVLLAERLAIWAERPAFNVAGRLSTERRQAIRAAIEAGHPDELYYPNTAARIIGLPEHDFRAAIRWGFIESDYPRAMYTTREQLFAFVAPEDRKVGAYPVGWSTPVTVRNEHTPLLAGLRPNHRQE